MEKQPLRTPRALPGLADLQLEKEKISAQTDIGQRCQKTTRKGQSGIETTSRNRRKIPAHCLTGEVSPTKLERWRFSKRPSSVFPSTVGAQNLGTAIQGYANRPTTSEGGVVCELLEEFDPYKS